MKYLKLVFCALLVQASFRALADEPTLRIGGSKVLSVLPLLALENNYYDQENIKVEFQNIEVGKFAMDAVLAGVVDVGTIVDSNIAFNTFSDNELVVLASILTYQANGLVYDSNLEDIKNLKAKKIAYFPATTSHLYLMYYLRSLGLNMKDIQGVILQPPAMLQALKENRIDIASIWNPWRYNILRTLGDKVKEAPLDMSIYPARGYIATTKSFLLNNRELLKKFLNSLKRAKEFALTNQEVLTARYAHWNNMDLETATNMQNCIIPELIFDSSIENIVEKDLSLITEEIPEFKNRPHRPVASLFDHSFEREMQ